MRYVRHMKIRPGLRLNELVKEMGGAGVLGAGKFARAVEILTEMFRHKDYTNFLAMAGPMIPGGLRRLVCSLTADGYVHALVTTGANVTHDLVEALGHRHIVGTATVNDVELRRSNISRIYDIYMKQKSIEDLEKQAYKMLDSIQPKKRMDISPYELLWEFAKHLKDKNSVLRTALSKGVPVFCPGIYDSMLGLHLWAYSRLKPLRVNPALDFTKMVEMADSARRVGAIILGGGQPKHQVLAANIYRGGLDSAIQISLDRPEGGGTSGAPLEEAISWGKIKDPRKIVTVIGDATILFPLMVQAALENAKHGRRSLA